MKRGIYLVANFRSQSFCENLLYSIRQSGCVLPIRIIHFGGKEINSPYILKEVEFLHFEDFSEEAKEFITDMRTVLSDCPLGYLYRYLAWFSDWDEFIYSDNDIVALSNWDLLFNYLSEYDIVHADEEYKTNGRYNYYKPELIEKIFGEGSLESAITAGHIVVKRKPQMIKDILSAIEWFKINTEIPKKHDQSLMHIASLLGNWNMLNLCKSPYNWLSSWAGDYKNSHQIIQLIQGKNTNISHIHYSGGNPKGNMAIQELLFAKDNTEERLTKLSYIGLKAISGYSGLSDHYLKVKKFILRKLARN